MTVARDNRLTRDRGFSLTDVLVSLAILASVLGIGLPMILSTLGNMRFNASVRDVQSELQTARLKAVSSNRPMRVRFNCPAAGEFRVVELIGTPAEPDLLDSAANRCSETQFPVVPPGSNVLLRPNQDGALRRLRRDVTFTVSQTIEFWPDGTAHVNTSGTNPWPQIGADVPISMVYKNTTKSITVNGVGKVQIQ